MKIRIKNFQPFTDTTLDVEGLTVLVGPSNRGKSALVRAVEGALFNRPGDGCIRVGAKSAEVAIDGLPNLPGSVVWSKGRSTAYTINGETYGKLSGDSPPALQAAGYRDLWIGDKERKKGEYLRPQVATQFDPPFLLTRSGGFLADVLNLVTRQQVLTTAQDRCGADLRSVKQQVGLKETAREQAIMRLHSLAGVPELAARLQALAARQAELVALRHRRDRVAEAWTDYRAAATAHGQLFTALRVTTPSTVLWNLLVRALRASTALVRWQQLRQVPTGLPVVAQAVSLIDLALRRHQARGALDRWQALTRVHRALPAPSTFQAAWTKTAQLQQSVSLLTTARRVAVLVVQQATAAAREAGTLLVEAEAQFHDTLAAQGVCPVCGRTG